MKSLHNTKGWGWCSPTHVVISLPLAVGLCVYTMKEGIHCKMQFESGRLTTTQQILSKMCEAFGIPEDIEHVFSIWLTSKHLRKQQLFVHT